MIVGSRHLFWTLAAVLSACDGKAGARQPDPPPEPGRTQARRESSWPTVVFLGTSLTAGYGLPDPDLAYPALIQRRIDSLGLRFRVVNAGISGASSADALQGIGWLLRQAPSVLVIETGANDGLRGQSPDSLRENIQAIIDRTRESAPDTRLVLAGMEALPNLGARYTRRFHAIYPELARRNHLPLIPFLLSGVAGVDSLNQADGIHPTARGQEIVAENVWKVLEPVLRSVPPPA